MKPTDAGFSWENEASFPPASSRERAFRVLVIDDDETDRELTIRQLGKAWPFEHEMIPDWAAAGPEALDKMAATHYALVVLDWRLPGMDGGEVLRAMRQKRVRTPVIVVSGMERLHILADIEALGAVFLNKDDMNPVSLHSAVAKSLRLLGLESALAA